jgi:hypothetical protein
LSKAFEKLFDGLINESTHNGYLVTYPTTASVEALSIGVARAIACRRYRSARIGDGVVQVRLSEVHSERDAEELEEQRSLDLGEFYE